MRFSSNAFELGVFSQNTQNGMAKLKTKLWDSSWADNVRVAQIAEEAGLEFLLPLGNWLGQRGYPAEADDEGGSFETLTWASGILAATKRIHVFGTLHVAYINPVFAAKQCVTAHHIGQGRFGLNVVSGNRDYQMLGLGQPLEHDDQYDYTEEWVTIVKRIWREAAPFDHSGTYFDLKKVISKPKPFGGRSPMLISAGHSHRGRAFAMEHTDALFTAITELNERTRRIALGARGRRKRCRTCRSTAAVIWSAARRAKRPKTTTTTSFTNWATGPTWTGCSNAGCAAVPTRWPTSTSQGAPDQRRRHAARDRQLRRRRRPVPATARRRAQRHRRRLPRLHSRRRAVALIGGRDARPRSTRPREQCPNSPNFFWITEPRSTPRIVRALLS